MNGMKEGTGDDPYATDDELEEKPESEPVDDSEEPLSTEPVRELPYIHRRDSVKEDRAQRPIWFREENEDRIPDRISELEDEFDEDIYRTDYLEAVVQADIEGVDTEDILRRWGYGMR